MRYECAVCTSEIDRRRSKVWSCHTCWTVFHLHCIKKWSSSAGAAVTVAGQQDGEDGGPRRWRCPGCNLAQETTPQGFTCWCGKESDPTSLPGLPPFSCGQTCSRPRSCPHSCSNMCHAGPCQPCAQMGPTQPCFCGMETKTKRCVDTDYDNGWSCGQVCNEPMACGKHYCGRPCHEGLCGSCEVPIEARCYCGQKSEDIPCHTLGDEKSSVRTEALEDGSSKLDEWMGVFNCGEPCGRQFDCGKHRCEKICHAQDRDTPHCPRSPDAVTHCPCGSTLLEKVSTSPRTSCEDDIPSCDSLCPKELPCGHICHRICHSGECIPCLEMVEVACRCGRSSTQMRCSERGSSPPACNRVCHASLNCGRHECGQTCCSGERKAANRLANKKKIRALSSAPYAGLDDYEAEHICTRICERQLKCGNHECQELCHRGFCGTCREAVFDEISCNCGQTVLQPPLPCGTEPPPCMFECRRPKACGHAQVSHNCHMDSENCPKCPFLTTKDCMCGKSRLKNQPCWLADVRCGEVCGKKLKCGFHRCQKTCHRPAECEDASKPCNQLCGKEKSCGHPCSDTCHSPFHCKEDRQCQHKLIVTCPCQRIKQEVKCNSTKTTPGNTEKALTCDAECLRLERNRKLAMALNIDPAHTDDHIPYAADTINQYLENPAWAQAQEKLLRALAADPDERRLRFKPMRNRQRAFVHSLAQDFGFDSESMDPEPHRHVVIFKTPRFVMAPMKTLADCVHIKQMQQLVANPSGTAAREHREATTTGDWNAFLITNMRFGLTVDELHAALAPVVLPHGGELDLHFLQPEEHVLLRIPGLGADAASRLTALKPAVARALVPSGGAERLGLVQLCRADEGNAVVRREAGGTGAGGATAGGWSTVVKKAARNEPPPPPAKEVEKEKAGFVTLGRKAREKVVEDWEAEQERLEREGY
jgi:transcriptional repressor NF-X1